MSENLRAFTKAIYGFDAVVRRMPPDRWTARSACVEWTGEDVLAHVRGVLAGVTAMATGEAVEPPARGDDRLADWDGTRDRLLEALDHEGCLQREGDTPFGRMTVDRFLGVLVIDPLCHTFDLAVAGGIDAALDRGLVARGHAQLERAGDGLRAPGLFGPAVEAPADATDAERFLALAGRSPRERATRAVRPSGPSG